MKFWRDVKTTWSMWKSLRAGGSIIVNCNFYGTTAELTNKTVNIRPALRKTGYEQGLDYFRDYNDNDDE